MYKSYLPYLQHILDECNLIICDVAKNIIPTLIPQIKEIIEAGDTMKEQ